MVSPKAAQKGKTRRAVKTTAKMEGEIILMGFLTKYQTKGKVEYKEKEGRGQRQNFAPFAPERNTRLPVKKTERAAQSQKKSQKNCPRLR